ncbi:unnamed protein product, partial [Discosporangium mesarthrocarpum]
CFGCWWQLGKVDMRRSFAARLSMQGTRAKFPGPPTLNARQLLGVGNVGAQQSATRHGSFAIECRSHDARMAGPARYISSTTTMLKGRRGGSSALIQKDRHGHRHAKKKSRKNEKAVGEHLWRIKEARRREAKAAREEEAIAALSSQERSRLEQVAEEFLSSPVGHPDLGGWTHLLDKDPDALLAQLEKPPVAIKSALYEKQKSGEGAG